MQSMQGPVARTAPDSAQAAIETAVAVILELWRGSFFFFSLCCGRAGIVSVCLHAERRVFLCFRLSWLI